MKTKFAWFLSALALTAGLFGGCIEKKEDTRQYIDCIGVVVTNNVGSIFEELFIFPPENGKDATGANLLPVTRKEVWTGSYGITLEKMPAYNVFIRDRAGTTYSIDDVVLYNGDEMVLSVTTVEVLSQEVEVASLTVYHRFGGVEEYLGDVLVPSDAPTRRPDTRTPVHYELDLANNTGKTITRITMLEADALYKGEVELMIHSFADGQEEKLAIKLYEEDKAVTAWVLKVEFEDEDPLFAYSTFNLWESEKVTLLYVEKQLREDEEPSMVLDLEVVKLPGAQASATPQPSPSSGQ